MIQMLAALTHGVEDLVLPSIAAFARPENTASIRVLLKCGFEPIGHEHTLSGNHYRVQRTN